MYSDQVHNEDSYSKITDSSWAKTWRDLGVFHKVSPESGLGHEGSELE